MQQEAKVEYEIVTIHGTYAEAVHLFQELCRQDSMSFQHTFKKFTARSESYRYAEASYEDLPRPLTLEESIQSILSADKRQVWKAMHYDHKIKFIATCSGIVRKLDSDLCKIVFFAEELCDPERSQLAEGIPTNYEDREGYEFSMGGFTFLPEETWGGLYRPSLYRGRVDELRKAAALFGLEKASPLFSKWKKYLEKNSSNQGCGYFKLPLPVVKEEYLYPLIFNSTNGALSIRELSETEDYTFVRIRLKQ